MVAQGTIYEAAAKLTPAILAALDLAYMPTYLVAAFAVTPISYVVLRAMGRDVDRHDAHFMERDAIIYSWPWNDPWQVNGK